MLKPRPPRAGTSKVSLTPRETSEGLQKVTLKPRPGKAKAGRAILKPRGVNLKRGTSGNPFLHNSEANGGSYGELLEKSRIWTGLDAESIWKDARGIRGLLRPSGLTPGDTMFHEKSDSLFRYRGENRWEELCAFMNKEGQCIRKRAPVATATFKSYE